MLFLLRKAMVNQDQNMVKKLSMRQVFFSKRPNPMSSSDSSSGSSFFSSLGASSAAAAAGAAPPAAGAAPTPDPTFETKSLILTDSRHLEKRPGQKGSTETLAAFKMVLIFSAVTATSSSARIKEA